MCKFQHKDYLDVIDLVPAVIITEHLLGGFAAVNLSIAIKELMTYVAWPGYFNSLQLICHLQLTDVSNVKYESVYDQSYLVYEWNC